jgi:hypothetical protein
VALQVADARSEIVFSPNPVTALLGAGNSCQLTALLLTNVGNSFINWTLVPYDPGTKDPWKNSVVFLPLAQRQRTRTRFCFQGAIQIISS